VLTAALLSHGAFAEDAVFTGGRMDAVPQTEQTDEQPTEAQSAEAPAKEDKTEIEETLTVLPGSKSITPGSKDSKLSLDIKGMAVVDLLKMISVRAGVNVIVGKNVSGQVSMFLRDVKVWDAFEIVLAANDLAYAEENGIVNVMTRKEYGALYGKEYRDRKDMAVVRLKHVKAKDLEKTIDLLKTEIGKVVTDDVSNSLILMDTPESIARMQRVIESSDSALVTKVFSLDYAQAEELSETINGLLSTAGSLQIDTRTDKIIVTDTPDVVARIADVVKAFDDKPQQVLIDAQIVEIKPSKSFKMGINWDAWMQKYLRMSAPFPVGEGASVGTLVSTVTTDSTTGTTTTSSDYRTVSGVDDWNVVMDGLRTLGDTKILSSPRIMAIDKQEAKLNVGTDVPYVASKTLAIGDNQQTSDNREIVTVGIILTVTPTISQQGTIEMKIKPEVSSFEYVNLGTDAAPRKYPQVTKSTVETSVVVSDGTTIIIGGLRKTESRKTENGIPILSSIPLIKYAFGNTSKEESESELVVFLTPHLMSGEKSFTAFTEVQPKDGVRIDLKDQRMKREYFGEAKARQPLTKKERKAKEQAEKEARKNEKR
jgi:type II secretory pathway component GspD/PulD (secretin)